jgi:hypothetical protein
MTVGFISPALRRGSPTDLTVRADRATLSDAAVEFAAADKAVLVREKDSQTTRAWTNGQRIVSFWFNTAALNDSDSPVIWSNDHIKFGYVQDAEEDDFYVDNNDINEIPERTLLSGFVAGWNHFFLHVTAAGEVSILINETVNESQEQGMQSTTGEMYFGGDEDGNYSTVKFDTFFLFEPDAGFNDFAGLHAWLFNEGEGRTSNELTAEQVAVWKPVSAYDFSARSSTGVWFDAVGGANLTEEFDATSTATSLPLTTGITAGLARAYGTDVGDSVSLWLDRSSEGNDLAQTSVVSQPMLVEVDGNEWIKFDGVDDRLTGSPVIIDHTNDFFYALVFRTGSSVAGLQVIFQNRIDNSNRFAINVSNGVVHARDGVGNFPQSNSVTTNTTYVLTYNLSSGVPTMHLNGLTGGNASVHTSLGDVLAIGSRGEGANPFSGFVGDLLIAPRAISTTERIRIERSLAAKYGITLAS